MSDFGTFSPKMTYFDHIDLINDYFDQIYVQKPDWNNWLKLLVKKLFDHFLQILTYDVFFAPKQCQNDPILTIFNKNDIFWPHLCSNDIFYQTSVHKPDWNNF